MFTVERYQEILEILKRKKTVTVSFLAKQLYSSEATIRRDLSSLEEQGYIRRIFGGAVLLEGFDVEEPLSVRESILEEDKLKLCRLAAEHLKDSENIILDSSSTILKIIRYLTGKNKLRIVTNGLKTAQLVAESSAIKLYLTGGEYRQNTMSFVGRKAEEFIAEYNADTLFFSCKGISLECGLTDTDEAEIQLRRVMLRSSKRKVLLADHSKFGNVFFCRLSDLNAVDCIVTDRKPDDRFIEYCKNNHIELIYC